MGQTTLQPNCEIGHSELYFGHPQFMPTDGKHVMTVFAILFGQRSRGFVAIKSTDPLENPIVNHCYLSDPLDMLAMTEACQLMNEIVVNGKGTKNIIKGSYLPNLTHNTYTKREDWEPFVREHARSCKFA